jgi:putative membrane protein
MFWHGAHMFGWGLPFGHGLFPILFGIILFAGFVALVRSRRRSGSMQMAGGRPPGLDILEERYAKGEIQRDEYLQKKQDLGA